MTKKTIRLESVLSRKEKATLNLELINADELKRMARFWFGTTLANKMRKAECLNSIEGVFKDRKRVEEGIRSLSDQERQILAVFKRYGGALSGPLLMCEALSRGLWDQTVERGTYSSKPQTKNPVEQLGNKLFLVTPGGGHLWRSQVLQLRLSVIPYPDLILQPIARDLIRGSRSRCPGRLIFLGVGAQPRRATPLDGGTKSPWIFGASLRRWLRADRG